MPSLRLICSALAVVMATASCSEAPMPPPDTSAAPTPVTAPTAAVEAEADPGSAPPDEINDEMAGICNIELIGEISDFPLDTPVRVTSDTSVSGWRALLAGDGSEAPAWLRVLAADGVVVFKAPLPGTEERPDVVAAVNRAGALRSGFRHAAITGLPKGIFTVDVVLNEGTRWVRCAHTRTLEVG